MKTPPATQAGQAINSMSNSSGHHNIKMKLAGQMNNNGMMDGMNLKGRVYVYNVPLVPQLSTFSSGPRLPPSLPTQNSYKKGK